MVVHSSVHDCDRIADSHISKGTAFQWTTIDQSSIWDTSGTFALTIVVRCSSCEHLRHCLTINSSPCHCGIHQVRSIPAKSQNGFGRFRKPRRYICWGEETIWGALPPSSWWWCEVCKIGKSVKCQIWTWRSHANLVVKKPTKKKHAAIIFSKRHSKHWMRMRSPWCFWPCRGVAWNFVSKRQSGGEFFYEALKKGTVSQENEAWIALGSMWKSPKIA